MTGPAIVPFADGFGAEVVGVRLSGELDDAARRTIHRAFLDHHVLAFRGHAELGPEDVLRASRLFGEELESHVFRQYHHPETRLIIVLSNRRDGDGTPLGLADAGTFWHSDVSYKPAPAKATLLYAVEVPEEGGDTLFCDMMAAYDALEDDMKERLQGLEAVHYYAHTSRDIFESGQAESPPQCHHPVVRRHPETDHPVLYVSPAYTSRIEGVDADESARLLEALFAHCLEDRFRMRYKWRAGDVLVWDNAAVMHSATTKHLDPSRYRTLWRTIISGGPTT